MAVYHELNNARCAARDLYSQGLSLDAIAQTLNASVMSPLRWRQQGVEASRLGYLTTEGPMLKACPPALGRVCRVIEHLRPDTDDPTVQLEVRRTADSRPSACGRFRKLARRPLGGRRWAPCAKRSASSWTIWRQDTNDLTPDPVHSRRAFRTRPMAEARSSCASAPAGNPGEFARGGPFAPAVLLCGERSGRSVCLTGRRTSAKL